MAKKMSVPEWYCWCLVSWLTKPKTYASVQGVAYDVECSVVAIAFKSPIGFGKCLPSGPEVVEVTKRQNKKVASLRFDALYARFGNSGITLSAEAVNVWSLDWGRFDYHRDEPKDIAVWLKANTPLVGNWYLPDHLPEGYDAPPG